MSFIYVENGATPTQVYETPASVEELSHEHSWMRFKTVDNEDVILPLRVITGIVEWPD